MSVVSQMVAAEVDTNKQSKAQITDDERLRWIALSARKIITASGKVSLTANRKFPHDWILTKCLYIDV